MVATALAFRFKGQLEHMPVLVSLGLGSEWLHRLDTPLPAPGLIKILIEAHHN